LDYLKAAAATMMIYGSFQCL